MCFSVRWQRLNDKRELRPKCHMFLVATEQNPPHSNQAALQSKALTIDRGFLMTQQSYAENTSLRTAFGEAFTPGIYSSQVEGQIFMQCLTFSFSTYYSKCARFYIFLCMYETLSRQGWSAFHATV